MISGEDTYTFLGTTPEGEPVFMDIAALPSEEAAIRHCESLLQSHRSGALIELWRGAGLITKISRPARLQSANANS